MAILRQAVHDVLHEGHDALRDVVGGLDADDLGWRPTATSNSIAALVAHSLDSERALLHHALDRPVERDREAMFRFVARDATELVAMIDRVEEETDRLVADVEPAHLGREVARWQTRLGAWWLLHALEHTREHAGQAMLTRELRSEVAGRPTNEATNR